MAAIVTNNYRVENARRFKQTLQDSKEFLYFFLGKPTAWTNEASPDNPVNSPDANISTYQDLLAMKKILPTNVKLGIKRYDWESGVFYNYYDHQNDLFDNTQDHFTPFYVVNSNLDVYKCLWNGSTRQSSAVANYNLPFTSTEVNESANTIEATAHEYNAGDYVSYAPGGGGTEIGGLTSGAVYNVIVVDADTIKLATSYANATAGSPTAINFSSAGTGNQTLQKIHRLFVLDTTIFTYNISNNELAVYVNGIRQANSAFSKTSSSRVIFNSGLSDADIVVFEKRIASTVEPTSLVTGTAQQIVELADGYRWKYMFQISASGASNFLTRNWMPVDLLLSDDSSNQFDIQDSSVAGIDSIIVMENGTSAIRNTGTISSATSTTAVLPNTASASNDYYNGMSLYIVSGTGIGQTKTITDYVGSSRTCVVSSWGTTPDNTSVYEITPTVSITSNTGSGCVARIPYSEIDGTTGKIKKVVVTTIGSGYLDAEVAVVPDTLATFKAILPGQYGHGNDAQKELGAVTCIINATFSGTQSNQIVAANEFRKTGIIKNPIVETGTAQGGSTTTLTLATAASSVNDFYNNEYVVILNGIGKGQVRKITDYVGSSRVATVDTFDVAPTNTSTYGIIASSTIYNMTTSLTYTTLSGTFSQDETVSQASSNATGTVVYVDSLNSYIYVTNVTGTFVTSQTITGEYSNATCSVSAVSNPSVIKNCSDVLVLDHRSNVTRSDSSIEDFKVILEF